MPLAFSGPVTTGRALTRLGVSFSTSEVAGETTRSRVRRVATELGSRGEPAVPPVLPQLALKCLTSAGFRATDVFSVSVSWAMSPLKRPETVLGCYCSQAISSS